MSRFFLLILLLSGFMSVIEKSESKNKRTKDLMQWLKKHETSFAKCHPVKLNSHYKLCDGTLILKKELKSLFKKTPLELILFLKNKKINLKISCNDKKSGSFKDYCSKEFDNSDNKNFKKTTFLHGQYKPQTNTIYLKSNSSTGSLIHEYIHYLQYQNKNKVFNKRYKYERILVQKSIVKQMDETIKKVKEKERSRNKKGITKLVKKMTNLARELKGFSKWQDLIDERSIFELFVTFEKELGISKIDIDLAKKNMGFICERKDLKGVVDTTYCPNGSSQEGLKYYKAVKTIIKEIRPKPDYSLIDKFLKNLPILKKDQTLKERIELVNDYIFNELKIIPDESDLSRNQKDNILPDTTLKLKHAHCVGLSTLYLLAFEKLKIKAYLVRLPAHVLVRACQEDQCFNIETLKKGKFYKQIDYINEGVVTKEAISQSVYFNSLKKGKDLSASLYLSLGYIAVKAKQFKLAEYLYKKSIDHARNFAEGYSNLAGVYSAQGKLRQSLTYLNIAYKVNPYHPATLLNLGVLSFYNKGYDKARSYINKAINLRPNFFRAYLKSAELYEKTGKNKMALLEYRKALVLRPRFCDIVQKAKKIDRSFSSGHCQ